MSSEEGGRTTVDSALLDLLSMYPGLAVGEREIVATREVDAEVTRLRARVAELERYSSEEQRKKKEHEPCMGRGCLAPSEGWENGWRLRLCLPCAAKTRDCNGHELDFSVDDPAKQEHYDALVSESMKQEDDADGH